ncbi:MAG: AAA domain-containing protein [Bacteroidota bacterium]
MIAVQKEIEAALELLKIERGEEYRQFKEVIEKMTLTERKQKGYTWTPLKLLRVGYTYGDRAYVILEQVQDGHQVHLFKSGSAVKLFTTRPKIFHPERSGVVHYIQKTKIRITLHSQELPPWILNGGEHFGVELLFDARTFQAMEEAFKQVLEAKNNRLAELRTILLGRQTPIFGPKSPLQIAELNHSQNLAVQDIVAARDVAVVHGPPGTGKTTTLVNAIKELCKTERCVLVCAQSNTAVDVLTERLANLDLNVVRIGNISRVDENLINHTLEVRISNHIESRNIKKVKLEAADARKKAWRFRRKYGAAERQERGRLLKEAKDLAAWARQLEERLIDQILHSAQVVTCTFVGSTHQVLDKHKFRTVVIDEAAQALEGATWIPITRASKVVLAGDPFQLPPTVKSLRALKKGLGITLIEKCIERLPQVSFLNTQYRMNTDIMGFSNTHFYNDQLQAHESVADHRLPSEHNQPIEFIDTAGCGFEEQTNKKGLSRYNPDEFQILCEHLYQVLDSLPEAYELSAAIISPYREQVKHIKRTISEDEKLKDRAIRVSTIDGFQGQECDLVYISLVRSNGKNDIGFLKDYRRMNVAMTRARRKLVVVGDSATIGNDTFYSAFLDYCDRLNSYRTAWEYMV